MSSARVPNLKKNHSWRWRDTFRAFLMLSILISAFDSANYHLPTRPGVISVIRVRFSTVKLGFAPEMNAQTGEVLFILVRFPVYRWSGMLAKCQECAWSGPRRIWTPRSENLVFRASGRILRPPTAQIRHMGTEKSKAAIKKFTAPPASAYSTPKKLKKIS